MLDVGCEEDRKFRDSELDVRPMLEGANVFRSSYVDTSPWILKTEALRVSQSNSSRARLPEIYYIIIL